MRITEKGIMELDSMETVEDGGRVNSPKGPFRNKVFEGIIAVFILSVALLIVFLGIRSHAAKVPVLTTEEKLELLLAEKEFRSTNDVVQQALVPYNAAKDKLNGLIEKDLKVRGLDPKKWVITQDLGIAEAPKPEVKK